VNLSQVPHVELLKMVRKAGGQRSFARKNNIPRTTLQKYLNKGRIDPFGHRPAPTALQAPAGRSRFILTSAQDCTLVHDGFLSNLEAYRDHLAKDAPCELMIAGFTYNKKLFESHAKHQTLYHERVTPYLVDERFRIADQVDFCGEMNTLPTAVRPLSDFQTYTRERWGIFPHAKVQLVSVATMKNAPPKQIMTTGAVTMPNYIAKKAGLKASFHHVYGAVLVEVDDDGTFFCRHLIGDEQDGSFYDLDAFVCDGEVSLDHRLDVLVPGDIHVAQIDPTMSRLLFDYWPTEGRDIVGNRRWKHGLTGTSMLDVMKPKHLMIHDVSDFRARNHHEIADPHTRFTHHIQGVEAVEAELREVAEFLKAIERDGTRVAIVDSNHDQALLRWLKTADYRTDPVNARFFLQCQLATYDAIANRVSSFSVFEHVMRRHFTGANLSAQTVFLREDESYEVGGVEQSNHGHRGANGSRGGLAGFAIMASKVNVGHAHSPGIQDGAYQSGTTSLLDMHYNKGASSWAHTLIGQYLSGKRVLITVMNGKWRI
jgi:hypothetical protein